MSGIVAGYFPHIPFPRAIGRAFVPPDPPGRRVPSSTSLDRRKAIFDFIETMLAVTGKSPTICEIQEHLGLKSQHAIHEHLTRLEALGYVKMGAVGQARSIRIVKPYSGDIMPDKIVHTCANVSPRDCQACNMRSSG
jgi:LexA DNA binding domain